MGGEVDEASEALSSESDCAGRTFRRLVVLDAVDVAVPSVDTLVFPESQGSFLAILEAEHAREEMEVAFSVNRLSRSHMVPPIR